MLNGKAPSTVWDLVQDGHLTGTVILTEAGHARRYVGIDSIGLYLKRQRGTVSRRAAGNTNTPGGRGCCGERVSNPTGRV